MDPTLTEIRKKMVGKTIKEVHFYHSDGEIRSMNIVFKNGGNVAIDATTYSALKMGV